MTVSMFQMQDAGVLTRAPQEDFVSDPERPVWKEQLCQEAIDLQRAKGPSCSSWEPCTLAWHGFHVCALFLTEGYWEYSVFALVPT